MPGLDTLVKTKLNRLETIPDNFILQVEKEQITLLNEVLNYLTKFETKNGKLILNAKNLVLVEKLGNNLENTMFEGEYIDSVRDFMSEFDEQALLNKEIFDKSFGTFTDKEIYDMTLKVSKQRAFDQLSRGAIAERFIEPLKEALRTNIVAGADIATISKFMFEYMTGKGVETVKDGQLINWIKQSVSDNFNIADREYTMAIANDLDVQWWRYAGGEIETTRCFCEQRNNQIFSSDEVREWGKPENANLWDKNDNCKGKGGGRFTETNESNIFVLLGGYNCRHSLIPLAEENVPDDIIKRNE